MMVPTVLYNEKLEPLTIIDLPIRAYTTPTSFWEVPVKDSLDLVSIDDTSKTDLYLVTLKREEFFYKKKSHCFFFINTEEEPLALKLKSSFLPGQITYAERKLGISLLSRLKESLK